MRSALLALLLSLAACSAQEASGGDILERERFKELLLQAQLIEARANHELLVEQVMQSPTAQYYTELLKSEGVTEAQFKATFDHYTARPEELKLIYEEIITELSFRKDQQ